MAGNDWMNERKSSKSSSLFGRKSSNDDYEAVNPNEAISGTAATSMMQQIISKRKAMIKEAANIVAKRLNGLENKVLDLDKVARLIDGLFEDPDNTFSDNEKYEILKYAIAIHIMDKY